MINQTPTEDLKIIRMQIYGFNPEITRFLVPRYNRVRNKNTNYEVFQCQTEFKIGKIGGIRDLGIASYDFQHEY
ncbi:MAG TPA: hypothetical protein DCY12_05550 [Candidatus Atribacteria bacterium]|nr:hypothetical protein [Candidatus Atribacteria bacterium]